MPEFAAAEDVVLFAPLGSNPALLTSCVWALARQRSLRVVEAHLVLFQRGIDFLNAELLGPGGGLDQFHSVLGATVLPRERLHVHAATADVDDTFVLHDDASAADALAYQNMVVQCAHGVTEGAGDRPVVFALLGGRRRTITAMATIVAQFTARRHDMVVDLRLDPRDDMAGDYFFSEQTEPKSFLVGGRMIRASDVSVSLVDVVLPRLRHLVGDTAPQSYPELLAFGQSAIDEATPLEMLIDLRGAKTAVVVTDPLNGTSRSLTLAPARKLVLASLALESHPTNGGWCRAATAGDDEHSFAKLCRSVVWAPACSGLAVRWFADRSSVMKPDEEEVDKALTLLRTRTGAALAKFVKAGGQRYSVIRIDKYKEKSDGALVHYQALRGVNTRVLLEPEPDH